MRDYRAFLIPVVAAFAFAVALLASPVFAQDQPSPGALPTAPGAERAGEGGLTSAPASLPGGPNGASPLEPWLVTWLLPVSGIIAVGFAVFVDRRVRMLDYAGRRARTVQRP